MTSIDISNALRNNPTTRSIFKGVCSADKLPSVQITSPSLFIVHTQNANVKTGHWEAIYVQPHVRVVFFDSFGRSPHVSSHIKFIQSQHLPVSHNARQLQSYYSFTCGQFCCLFAYTMARHKPLIYLLSRLSPNVSHSEYMARCLFSRYFALHVGIPETQRRVTANRCARAVDL